jgi:protein TonB
MSISVHSLISQRGWVRPATALGLSLVVHILFLANLSIPKRAAEPPRFIHVRIIGLSTTAELPRVVPEMAEVPSTQSAPVISSPAPALDSVPAGGVPEGSSAEPTPASQQTSNEGTGQNGPDEGSSGAGPGGSQAGVADGAGVGTAENGRGPGEEGGGAHGEGSTGSTEAAPAGGGAATGPDRDAILAGYRQQVLAAISEHKSYPSVARRLGQQGNVRVRFRVSADGAVSGASVVESSGSDSLDRAAIDAVNAAGPVPPIPSELDESSLVLTLTIVFSLN